MTAEIGRRAFLVGVGVVVAGCAGREETGGSVEESPTTTPSATAPATATSGESAPVALESHELRYDDDFGHATVGGFLRNTSDRELRYVQVNAYFYDVDTRIGEGVWNASNLGAGVRAQFETTPVRSDVYPTDYRLQLRISE